MTSQRFPGSGRTLNRFRSMKSGIQREIDHRNYPARKIGSGQGRAHRGRGRSLDRHRLPRVWSSERPSRHLSRARIRLQPAAESAIANRSQRGFRPADGRRHLACSANGRSGSHWGRQDLRGPDGRLHPHSHGRTRGGGDLNPLPPLHSLFPAPSRFPAPSSLRERGLLRNGCRAVSRSAPADLSLLIRRLRR